MHHAATHSLHFGGMGKRIEGIKLRKLLGWDKGYLIGKTKQNMEFIYYFQLAGYSQLAHLLPACCQDRMRSWKGLGTVQALLSNNKSISILPTLFPIQVQNVQIHIQIHSPIVAAVKKINTTPAKISTSWELCFWYLFSCMAYFWGILSTQGSY